MSKVRGDGKSRQGSLFSEGSRSAPSNEPFVPGPNPKLVDFIAKHCHPDDGWSPEAFQDDLVGVKTSPFYTFHPYWSKKDPVLINKYVLHYTRPGELVLDPFSGSGTTGLATLLANRATVLIDASPFAALLSHLCCLPGTPEDVERALENLLSVAGDEVDGLFATRCDRCGGEALTEYVIHSERFQCPACGEVVALFDCPQAKVPYPVGGKKAQRTELKRKVVCPHCLERRKEPHRDFVVSTRGKKFGTIPVLVRYRCLGLCKPAVGERCHDEDQRTKKGRFFKDYDLAKIDEIEKARLPYWTPPNVNLWDVLLYRLQHKKDFRPETASHFNDLYTKRNLWALAALRRALDERNHGKLETLLFTGLLHKCSQLMGCGSDQVGRTMPGTYYIAPLRMECRPTKYLHEALSDLKRHFQGKTEAGYAGGSWLVSATDATVALKTIADASVDYVFTDPPYAGAIQYGELNFIWDAWLGFDLKWVDNEIIVNLYRGKDLAVWESRMRQVFAEVFRVLRPGRWLSMCYHDTDPKTWSLVQNLLVDLGFEIATVTAQSTRQRSPNQISGEKVVKSDLVVNCRKPRASERGESEQGEVKLVSDRVRDILVETLLQTGGQTRDQLWDVVLKRLLSRGQMAEHRFDDILSQVAFRTESGRWCLKDEFESLSENDIRNEEKAGDALVRFARLRLTGVPAGLAAEVILRAPQLADSPVEEVQVESYIRDTLLKDLKTSAQFELGGRLSGVEFYDCLFFYLTRWLKGRPAGRTPRRNLADFLGEYLVRFKDGDKWLHRAPDDAEYEALRKARQTGLGRRIRLYIAYLRGQGEYPGERMPDAKTMVAWLKHCAAFGLAEEGVALFEKGGLIAQLDQLSKEEGFDAEDYYSQCRRRVGKPKAEDDAEDDHPGENEGGDDA